MMHHAFEIGGMAHYHSHQVLIHGVKLGKLLLFCLQIPQLSFSIGFLQQNKNSQQVIWCFDGE